MTANTMTQNQVIESLKTAASKDKAADAVLHVWAMRQRARNTVTVSALEQKMKAEGFKHDRQSYAKVLRLLADLGLGRLDTDAKGRVRALKDIKTSLQSIGAAACGQAGAKLKQFRTRNKFTKITPKFMERRIDVPKLETTTSVSLLVSINGKTVAFQVPKDLTPQEIALLVGRFQDKRSA